MEMLKITQALLPGRGGGGTFSVAVLVVVAAVYLIIQG